MKTRLAWPTVLLASTLSLACRRTAPPVMPYDLTRGEEVLQAMHDRYVSRWFGNLTYAQHVQPAETAQPAPVQLIAIDPPQRARIDTEPREAGNGMLILRDTQYVMSAGRPTQIFRAVNPLLLLQHDVYELPPSLTSARLKEVGFDLSAVRQDVWENRPVIVVGIGSAQFWVDRELMLLVRLVAPAAEDRTRIFDTRFTQFERVGSAWLARRIQVVSGGAPFASAELRQIRANSQLDSLLFRPDDWTRARHWYQQPIR